MTNKLITKIILNGFLSWLIPFGISFLFYKPGGELLVPYATFKSIIMVVGVASGSWLLLLSFKLITKDFIKNGVFIGFFWFAINIFLDALVLIPIMKTTFIDYFMTIGISYFAIPIISIAMGYLLKAKINDNEN